MGAITHSRQSIAETSNASRCPTRMQSTALSPRNVALAAFAVVVAIGVMFLSVLSMDHETPFTRADELIRAVGIAGVVAAAAGYLVQRNRLQRESPEARALN